MPVTEIAQLRCWPDRGDAFEAAVESAVEVIAGASAGRRCRVFRGVEEPDCFTLMVEWPDVESHSQFRSSPDFSRYRSFIQDLLAELPHFAHHTLVVGSGQ